MMDMPLPQKPHEVLRDMTPELADDMLGYFRDQQKELYKHTLALVAQARKVRPVFLSRKPLDERHRWVHQTLATSAQDEIAGNLLQSWLSGAHPEMLTDFLDALGVVHDENGLAEKLPPDPDPEKLEQAVQTLTGKYSLPMVRTYLQTFQVMNDSRWPKLDDHLEKLS